RNRVPNRSPAAARSSALLLDYVDGELGAVGARKRSLVLEPGRHGAVADLTRVPEIVEFEQLRGERVAPGMSLTTRAIHPHLESGWLRHRAPPGSAPDPCRLGRALRRGGPAGPLAGRSISARTLQSELHNRSCASPPSSSRCSS